jgi:hypothetical protein
MHADGRLGSKAVARAAAAKGVQVRQNRASAIAQQILSRNADAVEKVFRQALRSDSESVRLKAASELVKLAVGSQRQDTNDAVAQVNAASTLTREQMLDKLATALTVGPTASLLRAQIEDRADVVDGTASEV